LNLFEFIHLNRWIHVFRVGNGRSFHGIGKQGKIGKNRKNGKNLEKKNFHFSLGSLPKRVGDPSILCINAVFFYQLLMAIENK
jgi:hypothetical protein